MVKSGFNFVMVITSLILLLAVLLDLEMANADYIIDTIPVGDLPTGIAVNTRDGTIYVANAGSNSVSVIDKNGQVTANISVGESPVSIVYAHHTNKVYVSNCGSGSISVINAANNIVTKTIPNISCPDFEGGMFYEPNNKYVCMANFHSNSVSAIDVNNDRVYLIPGIPSLAGPKGITCFEDGLIVVAKPGTNTVNVNQEGAPSTDIPVGPSPLGVTHVPKNGDWGYAYVTIFGGGTGTRFDSVYVIDAENLTLMKTIPAARGAHAITSAFNPDNPIHKLYVTHFLRGVDIVSIIQMETNTVVETLNVHNPRGIAFNPRTNYVYVTNSDDDTVTVISSSILPETSLIHAYDGDGVLLEPGNDITESDQIEFAFTGTDNSGILDLECSLDNQNFSSCKSPLVYSSLRFGHHIFKVRAIDIYNNTDSSPLNFTWVRTLDYDSDGINNNVDIQPTRNSNNFSDKGVVGGQGLTTGTIITNGDQKLRISDAAYPAGVFVKAGASGGPNPAIVMVNDCNGSGTANYTFAAGTTLTLTCGGQ